MQQTIRSGKIKMYQLFKNKGDNHTTGFWYYDFRFDNRTIRQSSKEKDFSKACVIAEDYYNELLFKQKHDMPTCKRRRNTRPQ